MKNKLGIIILVLAGAVGGFLLLQPDKEAKGNFDEFAQCLADNRVTMYGAASCSHCQAEKKAFGDSFRLVPYVECPDDPQRCLAAGVTGFPTWIFPDGKILRGEQGLEKLSQESGCPLNRQN